MAGEAPANAIMDTELASAPAYPATSKKEVAQLALRATRDRDYRRAAALDTMERAHVPHSSSRTNVIPDGKQSVQGALAGLFAYGGTLGITNFTKQNPELVVYLNRFLRSWETAFRYTSIQINKDYSSKPHADRNNLGPSRIIGLGNYQGGEIWIERKGVSEPLTLQRDVPRYRRGETYMDQKVNIHNRLVEFGGTKLHFTFPFQGTRYNLIYFKTKHTGRAGARDLESLRKLCFPLPSTSAQSAYPTEGRERQKIRLRAMKEAGIEPKRKKFHIEPHHDDCGSDLSGLGPEWVHLMADYTAGMYQELPSEVGTPGARYDPEFLISTHAYTTSLSLWFLHGSEAVASDIATSRPNLRTCQTLDEFVFTSDQHSERDDLVELCGGAARVSTLCARSRMRCGGISTCSPMLISMARWNRERSNITLGLGILSR